MTDDETNTDTNRAYLTDPTTRQVLLMTRSPALNRWLPDLTALTAYRAGTLNVYRPGGSPTLYTVADFGAPILRWTQLASDDNDILATTPLATWIQPGTIVTDVAADDIRLMDAWLRSAAADGEPLLPPPPQETPEVFSDDAATRLGALLAAAAAARPEPIYYGHDWPRGPTLIYSPADPLDLVWRLVEPEPEPTAPPGQAQPPALPTVTALPKHVAALVLRQAEADGTTCPITLEPITVTTGAVTSCGHVFAAGALRTWIASHGCCPTCRAPTAAPA